MDTLHILELNFNLGFQSLGEWLYYPMRALSFLGDENFFIFGLALLYWGFHSRLGLRISVLLVLSISVNTFFKMMLAYPRPFWIDPQVTALTTEQSFGFPSGHAQNSTAIWGLVARKLNRSWVNYALIGLVFFIGLSRVYLGVHFFTDVFGGWLLGLLLLLAFMRLEPVVTRWLGTLDLKEQLVAILFSTLVLMAIMLFPIAVQQDWQMPAEWLAIASLSVPGFQPDPLNPENAFTLSGVWLGVLSGAAWLTASAGEFRAVGTPVSRLLRCLVGAVGLLVIRFGLGAIFPEGQDLFSLLLRFLRYGLLGAWVSAGAPLVFAWMKLTR